MRRLQIHVAARVIFANDWNTINLSLKASRGDGLHSVVYGSFKWFYGISPAPSDRVIFHSDENIDFDSLSPAFIRGRRDVDVCLSV